MPYEIVDAQGRCLYRGDDLALACEIHDRDPAARLMIPPAMSHGAPARRGQPSGHGRAPSSTPAR
jgi:hypothetical protein